jgi:DNA helicase-2/ATP-dependent DNA helicase PcrA
VRAVLAPLGLTATEPAGDRARARWASLRALVALTEELLEQHERLDLPGLLRELAVRAQARHPPVVQGVTLASLHAAKGLEWDAVFLVGLADGTLPISHVLGDSAEPQGLEEERRLLYVGVTRAREHLRLSWALSRTQGGRRNRRRSRFLAPLIPDASPASRVGRAGGATGAPSRRPTCRICDAPLLGVGATMLGRCETCPSEIDEELLAALREWRAETARAQSLPAFVVFSDNTLTAIAEQRPADTAALVAIPGIGATKLHRYGAEVIQLIRHHRR